MKTPDEVSKTRQKLYTAKSLWENKIEELSRLLTTATEPDKCNINKKLHYCEIQLLLCLKELDTVKRVVTPKQQMAGWGGTFGSARKAQ